MKDKAEKEAHRIAKKYWNLDILSFNTIIKCAIIDVSNTIEVLEISYLSEATNSESRSILKGIHDVRLFYTEVKSILKDKLD